MIQYSHQLISQNLNSVVSVMVGTIMDMVMAITDMVITDMVITDMVITDMVIMDMATASVLTEDMVSVEEEVVLVERTGNKTTHSCRCSSNSQEVKWVIS